MSWRGLPARLSPMTPEELEKLRARLGLTQAQAAYRLGVHERTWRKWARGERKIPPPVAKLLRLMITGQATNRIFETQGE